MLVKNHPAPPVKPAQPTTFSVALRRYLYLTAGVTGAAIMVIEILGAKMLSPYVGLSHFVWTAQIAVTLIALACGYYMGGRLADRSQKISWLYWAILAAAAYLSLSVLICAPVAYQCLDFNLAVGSLLASAILFFVPLALLAMTGPFLVRVITSSVSGVGTNVGRLTAISTLGSFAGTMLIGYFMIPFLPNSVTMFLTALALLLICTGYFGLFRRPAVGPLALILALSLITGLFLRSNLSAQPHKLVELFRGNSHFGQLQVLDEADGSTRYYWNDFLTQNTYDPFRKQSMSQFTYMLAGLARAYTTNIQDVLCIGLFASIRKALRPEGALVINAFASLEPGHDFFAASLNNTLRAVFRSVRIHSNGDGALFYVASDQPSLEFVRQPDLNDVHPSVVDKANQTYHSIVDTHPDHGLVLTDNYNPAEFYDARNREELRRYLASRAREM